MKETFVNDKREHQIAQEKLLRIHCSRPVPGKLTQKNQQQSYEFETAGKIMFHHVNLR